MATHTVRAACPHDCPDTCAMLVTVTDGRATAVKGDPGHPFTQGFLCTKVSRYHERTNSPDRLLYPMRRVGAKGEGRFERISWDAALDEIAARFREIADSADGPESILPYSYAGTMGLVQAESMDRRFFHRLGASLLARTICATAGATAWTHTIGATIGTDAEQFHKARFILLWGTNTLTSNVHLWPQILQARKSGAEVVVIDPYRNRTAAQADRWLAIRPGTDAALALGLAHIAFRDGYADRDYLEKYTLGADAYEARCAEYPPERVADITGLPVADIEWLGERYGTVRPTAIRTNYGLQRHRGGGNAVRAIAALPAVTGAWRDVGGGALLSASGRFPLNRTALERPDLMTGTPRTINMTRLGEALESAEPPVRALVVYNSNPAAIAPDQGAVLRGLGRDDLFTVVIEHFQTDTADYADILLPATTQLEHFDIVKPYGHYALMCNNPAIEPMGESKPNSEVFRLLAARMGFTESCFSDTDEEIAAQAIETDHPVFEGITLERLKRDGWARLNLPEQYAPFAEGGFPTASGKCEFHSERLAEMGLDPLADFVAPLESPASAPELAARFPLQFITPPAHSFLNSSFANMERSLRSEKQPTLLIHPVDAEPRGIDNGSVVSVFNDRGGCRLMAIVSEDVREGVVVAPSVWWNKKSPGGVNVNQTTSQALTDIGEGATFYDNLVEVEVVAAVDGIPETGGVIR
ncbi:MAG: molybdopterin oxidoreductase family protein [Blastocatellia bacterium]|nr:molybdopterin oxidoreductase family protein [Blastocatellia bacterium]